MSHAALAALALALGQPLLFETLFEVHDIHDPKFRVRKLLDDAIGRFMNFLQRLFGVFVHRVSLAGSHRGMLHAFDDASNRARRIKLGILGDVAADRTK